MLQEKLPDTLTRPALLAVDAEQDPCFHVVYHPNVAVICPVKGEIFLPAAAKCLVIGNC